MQVRDRSGGPESAGCFSLWDELPFEREIELRLVGDMLFLPKNIIQKAGLKDGDEVEI
ncbi:MAG: hypothetical protein ACYDHX_01940 [Methanothrix sp.]